MTSNEELKIVITADNKTQKAFNEVKKSTNVLQKDVSSFVSGIAKIGLAGAAAFGAFAVSAIKGAADAEASLARVDSILKTMGESALENRDALLAQAAAAVKLGFDDEAAAESIAKLYQRTGDLTEATNLNNLAMDLARAKSIDLESASKLVGMVMSGNARALKEFGIEIDETLPPMAALGVLQEKVAGQSEAFADTFQGRMATISESVSNLKDTFGLAMIEGLEPFIAMMTKWVSDPKNIQMVQNLANAIGKGLTGAFNLARLSMEGFQIIFDAMVDHWTRVLNILNKVSEELREIAQRFKEVGGGVSGAFGSSGGSSKKTKNVDDVIITPQGEVLETHPNDYIFASKDKPNFGGSGVSVVINNPMFLNEQMIEAVNRQLVDILKREMRI